MTLIKWTKNDETSPALSNLLESFFGRDFIANWFGRDIVGANIPAVNVVETRDNYRVEVAAPGFEKNDFKVIVEDGVLTIQSEKKEEKEEKDSRYTRREFSYHSFHRSFTLPETVNAERIEAKYVNGILSVTLPKVEEAKQKPAREIKIS